MTNMDQFRYTSDGKYGPWELISEVGIKRYVRATPPEPEVITPNPVNHSATIKNVTQDVRVHLYDLALAILDLNWNQQAELISYIAEESFVEDSPYDVKTQLRYIDDSEWLSEEGRELLNQIGQRFTKSN